ncbi:MAG: hypothetical protein ACPGNT_03985 [Rhodospirillales bacterium]
MTNSGGKTLWISGLLAVSLSACSTVDPVAQLGLGEGVSLSRCTLESFTADSDAFDEAMASDVMTPAQQAAVENAMRLPAFLKMQNCLLRLTGSQATDAPLPTPNAQVKRLEYDPADPDSMVGVRALVGHAAVGALAKYGALYLGIEEDISTRRSGAAALLQLVKSAETDLWQASQAGSDAGGFLGRLVRVQKVIGVAEEASKPAIRRAKSFIEKIILAVGTGSVAALPGRDDWLGVVRRAYLVRGYGNAYALDVRSVVVASLNKGGTVGADDFARIDGMLLQDACTELALLAGLPASEGTCIPDRS